MENSMLSAGAMRWRTSLALVTIVTACGSQPPPSPGTPGASDSASPAAGSAASSSSPGLSAEAGGPSGPVVESQRKAGFLTGCSGGDSRKTPYCQCAWTSLRKTLSLADFLSDFQGERFDDAKKALVLACKGSFPEEVAKTEWQGLCTKGDSAAAPTCRCVWKKLRAKYSTEEIAAGLADVKSTPGVDACSNK
jgi:hypothetical protein